MKKIIKSLLLPATVLLASCAGTTGQQEESFNYLDERFADIQMLRYNVEGFEALTLQQKTFIYHLYDTTIDPVIYDITRTDQSNLLYLKVTFTVRCCLE